MHGLPAEFKYDELLGHELEYVSFSVNNIHLSFSSQVSITIESSYSRCNDGQAAGEPLICKVPVGESDLMSLVGSKITRASAEGRGTLVLSLSNGSVLRVYDDSPQFESYAIRIRSRETFV